MAKVKQGRGEESRLGEPEKSHLGCQVKVSLGQNTGEGEVHWVAQKVKARVQDEEGIHQSWLLPKQDSRSKLTPTEEQGSHG